MMQRLMKQTCVMLTVVCFMMTLSFVWSSKTFLPSNSDVKYTPFIAELDIKLRVICAILCRNKALCLNFGFHAVQGKCRLYKSIKDVWQSPVSQEAESGWQIFTIQTVGNNVAKFKTVTSSSLNPTSAHQVINNDVQLDYFQTGSGDFYPWVLIDLEHVYSVEFIIVYKLGLYPEFLHNVNYEFHMEDPNLVNNSKPCCCASTPGFYGEGRNIVRCNTNTKGRYLMIYTFEKLEFLTINELEVLGELSDREVALPSLCRQPVDYGQNIARNKRTSSQYFPDTFSVAAVDGDLNSHGIIFFNTGLFPFPWWAVDLKDQFRITSVTIYSRTIVTEVEAYLFRDVTIHVYPDTFDPSAVCVFIPGPVGRTVRKFTCTNTTIGRHLRISQPLPRIELLEVEVTGEKQ